MILNKHKRYNNSIKGIARQLRSNHGYSKKDSIFLASILTSDYCSCFICGVPVWWLRIKNWQVCRKRNYWRQTVDHIDPNGPSILKNTRPLCAPCNSLRGANILTDEEVLRKVRKWWRNLLPLRFLFWLNKTPNSGGTIWRNKYMMKKEFKLREIELQRLGC